MLMMSSHSNCNQSSALGCTCLGRITEREPERLEQPPALFVSDPWLLRALLSLCPLSWTVAVPSTQRTGVA